MTKEKKILKNYLLYFLLMIFVCIIGISDVMAWDWTNSNGITYTAVGYITNDTQIQIEVTYETSSGAPLQVAVDQTVNTEIKTLYINLDNYTFLANTRYELELNLPNNKLVYANTYSVTSINGEQCMISLSDSEFNSEYSRFDFQCPSATNSIAISVYNSNNTAITQSGIFSWHYSHLYSSTMPINSSTTNNNDLINNANQNADRVINNQNQNTQDIINNQNANTDKQIESQQVCKTYENSDFNITYGYYINNVGGISSDSQLYGYTNEFYQLDKLYINSTTTSGRTFTCFYNENKEKISCVATNSMSVGQYSLPEGTKYIRFSFFRDLPKYVIEVCTNGNQALNDSITGLNDSINDDDIDDNGIGSAFDDFDDFLDDNSTITQLITLPITLYTAILNNLNGTCQPFNLGKLFREDLILPCINISQYLGSSLWSMIDIIISAFAIFRISKKMIKVFNNFSSLREGDVIDD